MDVLWIYNGGHEAGHWPEMKILCVFQGVYLFRGSGCRAATTPPRAAAERLGRTHRFAVGHCAAARGATRRSATSSTTDTRALPLAGVNHALGVTPPALS